MLYELWQHDGGQDFFPRCSDIDDYERRVAELQEEVIGARLVWSVEAKDDHEAATRMQEFLKSGESRPGQPITQSGPGKPR